MGGILGSGRFQNLSWSLLALVWIPMFAFLVWGRGGVLNHMTMKREVSDIEAEIRTLHQENNQLEKEIRLLETDPGVYEGAARQHLLRKRPGEIILYLPDESAPLTGTAPMAAPPSNGRPYPPSGEVLGTPAPETAQPPASGSPAGVEITPPSADPVLVEVPQVLAPARTSATRAELPESVVPPTAADNPSPSAALPGDPGWLQSNPSGRQEPTTHTGNPMPDDPEGSGG